PEGKPLTPPPKCEIWGIEPETGYFRVRLTNGFAKGLIRPEGGLLVPVAYDDITAVPESGIWLASRLDVTTKAQLIGTILTGVNLGPFGGDSVTVDVYDSSGQTIRSFRSKHWPTVSGDTYSYESKGSKRHVNALTGEPVPTVAKQSSPASPDGFRFFQKAGKYGIKTTDGTVLAPPIYRRLKYLGGSLFAAALAGGKDAEQKWGAIDPTGKAIVPFSFDVLEAVNFPDRDTGPILTHGNLDGRKTGYWLVDRTGRFLNPRDSPFEKLYIFNSVGQAEARLNGKVGIVNHKGQVIVPIEYDSILEERPTEPENPRGASPGPSDGKNLSNGTDLSNVPDPSGQSATRVEDYLYRVRLDDFWGLYDGAGKALIPVRYGFVDVESGQEWARVEGEGRQG
ncbi:MAG: WG repeat-containing protein, partial [Deltaproteobacteria bacterium]|nr:WG repeat-containing protein [Deltaproteobacteria bacterium]